MRRWAVPAILGGIVVGVVSLQALFITDFFHHYTEILTDPAHTSVEFTFVLIDVLLIQAAINWLHKRLDKEHGVENHRPVETVSKAEYDALAARLKNIEDWCYGRAEDAVAIKE